MVMPEYPIGQCVEDRGDLGTWFTPGRFAGILGLLIFFSYPGVVLGWTTFVFRDFGLYGYPVAHYYRECFWRGELPLWNPFNNCGIPFLAHWSTLVLYPFSLFYLVFPLSWSLAVFCLVHLFLAGLGMYWLAWRWTGHSLAAGVAGVAYAFNGLVLNCLIWPHCMVVWGWMPWVILTAERAWRKGGRRIIVAALVGALQMLGGVPEWILLTWIIVGGLWVREWLSAPQLTRRYAGRFLLVIILIAGLTAAQLFPFFEFLRHSQRDAHFAFDQWSIPGTGWANLFVPLFRCWPSPQGVFFQKDQYFTSSYYLGIGVLFFAIWSWGLARDKRVGLLTLFAGSGLILALGNQGYVLGWLHQTFSQLGLMRYPAKFLMWTTVTVPLLAAFGVRHLVQGPRPPRGLAAGLWLIILTGITGIVWFSHSYPGNGEQWTATMRNGLSRAAFLTLILGVILGVRCHSVRWRRWPIGLGLLVVAWLDVQTHMPNQNPTVLRSAYEPGLPTLRTMQPRPAIGESRAATKGDSYRQQSEKGLADSLQNYLCYRLWLLENANLLDHIPKIAGFYSLYLREENEVVVNFMLTGSAAPEPLADYLGISQITDSQKGLEWETRRTYMPLVTAGQKPIFLAASNSLAAVLQSSFNPRQIIYLDIAAKPFINATHQPGARIQSQHVTAHRWDFEVETVQPTMVSIAQSFYPAWHAYIDGQPTQLWRANHAFQALEAPAGRHRVVLIYEDHWFYGGLMVSLITMVACLVGWMVCQPKAKNLWLT